MESDFGYCDYPENAADEWNPVYPLSSSICAEIVHEKVEITEKARKKKRKCSVVEVAKKLPKKQNNRSQNIVQVSSAEEFYRVILCWSVSSLSSDSTPFNYCVHPLSFSTQAEYIKCMLATCFEESRAVLKTALYESNTNASGSKAIKISLTACSKIYESTSPGVYCIDCQICTVFNGKKVEKYYPTQTKLNAHTATTIQKSGLIYILSVDKTLSMQSSQNKLCILTSYADSDEKKATLDSCNVTLCFHRSLSDDSSYVLSIGSTITVYTCCSLLSYQRMAVACTRSASSPIVQKLISPMKQAMHIKFDDDAETNELGKEDNTTLEAMDTFSSILEVLESPYQHSDAISDEASKLLRSLNPSQKVAVSRFLRPAVRASAEGTKMFGHLNLIQGPPG